MTERNEGAICKIHRNNMCLLNPTRWGVEAHMTDGERVILQALATIEAQLAEAVLARIETEPYRIGGYR